MQFKTLRYRYRHRPESTKNVQSTVYSFIELYITVVHWQCILQVIDSDELKTKANLSFPHTSHCLANGQIMVSAMGDVDGNAKGMHHMTQ